MLIQAEFCSEKSPPAKGCPMVHAHICFIDSEYPANISVDETKNGFFIPYTTTMFVLDWTMPCNSPVLKLATDPAQLKFSCLTQIAVIFQTKLVPPFLSTLLQFSNLDQHIWFTSHKCWIFRSRSYVFLNHYDCTYCNPMSRIRNLTCSWQFCNRKPRWSLQRFPLKAKRALRKQQCDLRKSPISTEAK